MVRRGIGQDRLRDYSPSQYQPLQLVSTFSRTSFEEKEAVGVAADPRETAEGHPQEERDPTGGGREVQHDSLGPDCENEAACLPSNALYCKTFFNFFNFYVYYINTLHRGSGCSVWSLPRTQGQGLHFYCEAS